MYLNIADFNTGTKAPTKVKGIASIVTEEVILNFNIHTINILFIL